MMMTFREQQEDGAAVRYTAMPEYSHNCRPAMPPSCMGMLSQTPASMLELQPSAPCTANARVLTLLGTSCCR